MSRSMFLLVVIFFLTAFNMSCSTYHLNMKPFNICVPEGIFNLPLLLRNIFVVCRVLRSLFWMLWGFFFLFRILKILIHYVLVIIVSDEKSVVLIFFSSSVGNVSFSFECF